MLTLDKDDSNWEVMSSVSSRSDKGYSRVMRRLLKQSNQLTMVMDGTVEKHLSIECISASALLQFSLPLLI